MMLRLACIALWLIVFAAAVWQETRDHHARFDLWLEPAADLHPDSVIVDGLPYIVCRKWNRFSLVNTLFSLVPRDLDTAKLYPGECKEVGIQFIPQTNAEKTFRLRETGADLIIALTCTLLLFHFAHTIKERLKCRNQQ